MKVYTFSVTYTRFGVNSCSHISVTASCLTSAWKKIVKSIPYLTSLSHISLYDIVSIKE